MQRRGFLKASAAAAGALALGPMRWAHAQSGRAPQQAGEGQVRITDIKLFTPGRLILRIDTDAGVSGWGEVNIFTPVIGQAIAKTYKPLLVGMDPTRIEHIWQLLHRAHRNMRGGLAFASVIGGIDIALWDILGKLTEMPLYRLLGGPCRNRIRRYPGKSSWKQTTHRLHRMVETPMPIDAIVHDVAKTREKLGPNGFLMLDGHGKFTAQAAVQLAKKVEPYDVLFFEEVVPPENNADLVRVKRATTVPLAAGERMATIWPFRQVLEDQAVDVLNPDIVQLGGVSQLTKLAGIAELYDVPLAPHSTHSEIALAASLHVAASINNFLIHEAYQQKNSWAKGLDWSAPDHFALPAGAGLGVQVDQDALQAASDAWQKGDRKGLKKAYFLNDGSVADR
ncbi:MAG: mandelate racemase/muconate lactonizing enzyme family protein [Phycisphaerae bacterium]